jgi:hypothetical protein
VHNVGIMFAGKDVASAPHIGCELIDFIEATVDNMSHEVWITEIADHEIVGVRFAETWEFEIGTSNPKTFPLKTPDEVMTNEATGPTNQGDFSRHWLLHHVISSQWSSPRIGRLPL